MLPRHQKKILIADDDAMIRDVLKAMLRSDSHTVVGEAGNGEQALAMTEQLAPEVVLLDIHMPKMDGLEALETFKTKFPETMVIMISGDASLPSVKDALAKGARGFIVKPFNAAKVLDTIQRCVQPKVT